MLTIRQGDCRQVLATLPAQSVHCCVTSPPYFGLRDYGTAQWQGGDAVCDHIAKRTDGASTLKNDGRENFGILEHHKVIGKPYRDVCGKCGAYRIDNQIGLEATPDEYVAELVAVFREVRRVLRDDGTLWLNLGDSYNGSGATGGAGKQYTNGGSVTRPDARAGYGGSLKQKDLIGIPWRVAFALQADGWYLRQDIIWSKPNPMPESVTDRCTKAHEYIFLMSKRARYFYDADAIKEEGAGRIDLGKMKFDGRINRGGWINDGGEKNNDTRNKRSVWEVATSPYSEAHFATFPPDLIEPCILAGCPKGGTVLDPFGGAGTTGLVADRLGRNALLIELNPAYADMAKQRMVKDAGLFADIQDFPIPG